mgnify:CR=1 FL=1
MVADVVWDIFIENMVKIKRTLAEKKFSVRVLFLQEKTVRYGMIVGKIR